MDLWLIAATAATGYIAKYVQNVSKGKDNFTEASSEDFSNVKPESPRCMVSRLVGVKKPKEESFETRRMITDGKSLDIQERDNAYRMEEPSTSAEGSGNNERIHSDYSVSSVPEFADNGSQNWPIHDFPMGDRKTNLFQSSFRNRTFLRRKQQRYKRLVQPLNSVESCLITQFHREQMNMEEYMLSPFPSPCAPVTRPLLVTDGTRVINANSLGPLSGQIQNEDRTDHALGIPPLTKLQSSSVSNKRRIGNRRTTVSRRHAHGHGPNDTALLLCIGISIGMISFFIVRKTEVDKLKNVLKQTENLVQDLQDELEMKDSLTVRELENENKKNNDLDCVENDGRQCGQKAENSESMSKIEAELEAELERLELNINTSNIETQLSDTIGLDPEFEVDFARGELRADRIKRQPFEETESNQDPSGNSTPESGNYAVSPRELSLRLHEVINSRLEERIKELEVALRESQREVEQMRMEAEHKKNSWSRLWESHDEVIRHERERETPVAMEHTENNPVETEPLVMNLAGEALDAYNDAYDELMKINEDSEEEEDLPTKTHEERNREGLLMGKNTPWNHKRYIKDPSRTEENVNLSVQELLDLVGLSEDEDENSDCESEMEKQLIKQIVEKTKQGSPVVLNAQKMLFLMEEREENP
ncbi:PREDICTED: uncharacterized protein LOC104819401 [Tarenaya hassleriana]|uniref:uncharacterized protein LOC104819401 n=1 Tax=Tarenaya hassleriana TaxID=28532 RepID=UPI00053C369B|nr:PREDICTED: uncharacterized protein LOC104819401 [Tarenaya hassleriana]XP_010547752.1 PREDICTED: uncharacterized protein LOC104819401 [Tarenaya hassleriana]XP_010547753.1 PREDICTED: uncharacterized protein LOC104819401 [Tarenaya hassleriana]XP_010547754.1 PREDICTED: uncharacterized protein LOC104819401 [Tarenaya hassleriana]